MGLVDFDMIDSNADGAINVAEGLVGQINYAVVQMHDPAAE